MKARLKIPAFGRSRRPLVVAPLLVAAVMVVAIVAAVAGSPATVSSALADETPALTVVGPSGTVELTMEQIQALTPYEGYAGMKNSAGTITPPHPVEGVTISDLAALVGGIGATDSVTVRASDGYGMTYTHAQAVEGTWTAYDPANGDTVNPTQPFTMIVGYGENTDDLANYLPIPPAPGGEGPLRIFVAQPEAGQVVDGHLLVKWVNRVEIGLAKPDWKVRMYGLLRKNRTRQTYTLDRSSYLSCAAPGCHGSSYKDAKGHVWTGVPLFLCVGKVDGGKQHDYGAYNEALALRGYRIRVINASGRYVTIGSRLIMNRSRIILANKVDGKELGSAYPLRLVGPKIGTSKWIGRITKIRLLPRL
jgi:DMSO/TMAO reductase YedYZ molybdopterin-dependent catalytic subunit